MTVKTEPFISGKYGWDFGESGWNVGADENWLKFSYLLNGVYHGFETSDANAGLYANGTAYWNSTDLTINPKVNGTTYKWSVPAGYVLHSSDGSTKWQFTGSTLVRAPAPSDWTKLNNIQANATANSPDGTLLDRANHTGTQATTTVTGLEPRLISLEGTKADSTNPVINGTLIMNSVGGKIMGEFSSTTPSNRTLLQSTNVNSPTRVDAIPNGTSTTATVGAINNSSPNNSSGVRIAATSSDTRLESITFGSGSYLPLNLYNSGTARLTILPNGNVGVGTSPSVKLDVGGNIALNDDISIRDLDSTVSTMNAVMSFRDSSNSQVGYIGFAGAGALELYNDTREIRTLSPFNSTQGAKFGNTARADTNTLDWYEEGTFTPTVIGASISGTGTYGARVGIFTRIGNIVYFNISLSWTAHTGVGGTRITGLPYNTSSDGNRYCYSVYYENLTIGSGKQLAARSGIGSSTIFLEANDPAGGSSDAFLMDTSVTSLVISGFYRC
jgi:hypothetical protein